jgi:formylmethanofuran dehydrogenase subunit E
LNDIDLANPRLEIEEAIAANDLPKLLKMTGMLHGHFCPFSALGVKAANLAVRELKAKSKGMEGVIAIVETNNCFSDGVQFVTGCSFGNNSLIYRDVGKTAFTLTKRDGSAIRVAVKTARVMQERGDEATELWQKVIVERGGNEADQERLNELWRELSFKLLSLPDNEVLDIQNNQIQVPEFSRIFANAKCSVCGESIMEPRARIKDGEITCIPCAKQAYYQLSGNGISLIVP